MPLSKYVQSMIESHAQLLTYIPVVGSMLEKLIVADVAKDVGKEVRSIKSSWDQKRAKIKKPITEFPREGMEPLAILENLLNRELTGSDIYEYERLVQFYTTNNPVVNLQKEGIKAASGALYAPNDPKLFALMAFINQYMPYANTMQTSMSPVSQICEAEAIHFEAQLLKGKKYGVRGFVTEGGTASIGEAMLAYKRCAQQRNPGQTTFKIIVPETIHAAFTKLENYGITVAVAKCDPNTSEVLIHEVEGLIDENTICLVGSACTFPTGAVDDFQELSELAFNHSTEQQPIGLHADMCLGGNHIPFSNVERIKKINFEDCPSLTSVSKDDHKTGYTPKGTSTVLLVDELYHTLRRDLEKRSKQLLEDKLKRVNYSLFAGSIYTQLDFMGGKYATLGYFRGSRNGVSPIQSWAAKLYFGLNGYKAEVERHQRMLAEFKELLKTDLELSKHVEILGAAEVCVINLRSKSDDLDIHKVADKLVEAGWNVHYSVEPFKGLHICLTAAALDMNKTEEKLDGFAINFKNALSEAVNFVIENPKAVYKGDSGLYGAIGKIPKDPLINDYAQRMMTWGYMDTLCSVSEKDDNLATHVEQDQPLQFN